MINRKSREDLKRMRHAGHIVALVHKKMRDVIEPGISTLELDNIAAGIIRENRAIPTFLGYHGFPRSVEQAEKLEIIRKELNDLNSSFFAIYFDIDTDILMERIVNRRSCPVCGEIYNLAFKPPEKEGICDKCGSKLTQRKDDTREVARARFDTYNTETAPLTEYYEQKGLLKCVDADGSIDEVWERLLKIIRKAD